MTTCLARRPAALPYPFVLTLLAGLAGCGNRDGHQVPADRPHNLEVVNPTSERVAVYAGWNQEDAALAGRLGTVEPGATGCFRLRSGAYKLVVRFHGRDSLHTIERHVTLGRHDLWSERVDDQP